MLQKFFRFGENEQCYWEFLMTKIFFFGPSNLGFLRLLYFKIFIMYSYYTHCKWSRFCAKQLLLSNCSIKIAKLIQTFCSALKSDKSTSLAAFFFQMEFGSENTIGMKKKHQIDFCCWHFQNIILVALILKFKSLWILGHKHFTPLMVDLRQDINGLP